METLRERPFILIDIRRIDRLGVCMGDHKLFQTGCLAFEQSAVHTASLREVGKLKGTNVFEHEVIAPCHRKFMIDASTLDDADKVVPRRRFQPIPPHEEREILAVRIAVADQELEQRPAKQG